MSRYHLHISCLGAALMLILSLAPTGIAAADKVALLIGNSNYERPSLALRNPENDVFALGISLRKLGFRVDEAINQDLAGMEAAIDEFQITAEDAEIALFFYAGHGVQIAGDNHLIGTDFVGANANALKRASITMTDVRDAFGAAQPDIGILILDACRNNPFADAEVVEHGLVRSGGGAGMLIAYATDPGNIAFDGAGKNSVFTGALLDHISTPGLEARLMFGRVRQQVVLETDGQQIPWVEEAVLGEHYFASTAAKNDPDDEFAVELQMWREISDSTEPATFRQYLAAYPQGLFEEFALERITVLENPTVSLLPLKALPDNVTSAENLNAVTSALAALGLVPPQHALTRNLESDVIPAFEAYRRQLVDPGSASLDQLYSDATRVSMVLAAATLQRIRTDIVALRGVDGTLTIAQDALAQMGRIAESDSAARPILQAAKNDVDAIRLSRANILRRLDHSRNYYDEVLVRAVNFVPKNATVGLIGSKDRSRDLSQATRQLTGDATLFLKHVSQANEATKGSYAWLSDVIPEK